MAEPISALSAISSAVELTKAQLFRPFRLGRWARLAVVCLLTGKFVGGGGGWGNLPSSDDGDSGNGLQSLALPQMPDLPDLPDLTKVLPLIPLVLAALVLVSVLVLAFIYVASVFRFILFDSVLHDRCLIADGWRRLRRKGERYFLWLVTLGMTVLGGLLFIIAAPVLLAWNAGVFSRPEDHIPFLIAGGILTFFALIGFILLADLVGVASDDFLVPLMALEDLRITEAWRRFLSMLGADKGGYTIYVLLKLALVIGCAILFGIIKLLVAFNLLVPVTLLSGVIVLAGWAVGLSWGPVTIGLTAVAGAIVAAGFIYVAAFVSTPAMVFFQAFTLTFFGSRYPKLNDLLTQSGSRQ